MRLHEYEKDTHSGAGNCTCGAAERHARHPHMYLRGLWPSGGEKCTCGLPPEADQHVATLGEGA
jgi:hypothetical protein